MTHSLFAHLALHFGSHPENLATEALGFILQKSPAARAGVAETLLACGVNVAGELTYSTQVTGDDDARPDLVGRDEHGAEPLLVEVKFWAGLTENQPVKYLGRLKPGAVLLVVAPAARLALLWGELGRRCIDARQSFAERSTTLAGAQAATVSERNLVLLSWRTLLSAINRHVDAAGDKKTVEDVAQLDGLCDRMDTEAFLPVTSEELTTTVYRRVIEFGTIVEDLCGKLVENGIASTKGLGWHKGNGFYGRYLSLRGVGILLLCDLRKWTKYASTPLWLSVYGPRWKEPAEAQRALAQLAAAAPGKVFKAGDGFPTVALFVPSGVERGEVLARVYAQVEEVAAAIASLGGGGLDTSVKPPGEP